LLLTGADAGGLLRQHSLLALPSQKLADPASPGPEEGGDDEELQEAQAYIRWGGVGWGGGRGWGVGGAGKDELIYYILPLQRIVSVCPCVSLGPAAARMHQAGTLRPIYETPPTSPKSNPRTTHDRRRRCRKLHAYLEPRMLRRMKAVCLAGQMPPKVGACNGGACRLAGLSRSLAAPAAWLLIIFQCLLIPHLKAMHGHIARPWSACPRSIPPALPAYLSVPPLPPPTSICDLSVSAPALPPHFPAQITRRVACRMTPLQLQLYLDLLAKDWDRVHAMGALQPPPPHATRCCEQRAAHNRSLRQWASPRLRASWPVATSRAGCPAVLSFHRAVASSGAPADSLPLFPHANPASLAAVSNRLEKKSMNNILIRLRQACMHPYLLPGQEPEVGGRAIAAPGCCIWAERPPPAAGSQPWTLPHCPSSCHVT
jgi:hypothetical protein